jgi:hypothetical protein
VEGYILIYIFSKNIAWEYKGWDAYFNGNIKLQYYLPWLGLGLILELLWDILLLPMFLYLDFMNAVPYVTLCGIVLTLLFSPYMGIRAIMNIKK